MGSVVLDYLIELEIMKMVEAPVLFISSTALSSRP